jgi:hypothetical protein
MLKGLLVAVVSALVVISAYADETSEQAIAQAPATNAESVTIRIGGKRVPKELAEKLTGDQIVALLKDQNTDSIPKLAPVIVMIPFVFVVALVTVISIAQHRRKAMLHRTLAAMIEKGVPIPPELLQSSEAVNPKRSDLRRGLVACGVGIGLILFLGIAGGGLVGMKHQSGLWAVGFIPLFVGIGRLIAWKLEQRKPNS